MPHEVLLLSSTDGGDQLTAPVTGVQNKLHVVPYYWDAVGLTYVVAQQAGGGTGGGGDASAANQTTEIAKLTSIDGKTPSLGQALAASSLPVVLTAAQLSTLTPLSSVSVSNFPATQPVSGTVSTGLTQPLTDTQLRASAVPVSGTFFQSTQPVSIAATVGVSGPLTDTQLRATAVPVSGTFFQATQPVSLASVPSHAVTNAGTFAVQDTNMDVALSTRLKPADTLTKVATVDTITNPVAVPAATLVVTAVSAANATVTATLPAVAAQFHYISRIVIERVATTAIVGSATLTYTSTNLPGSWARTSGNAAPVGQQMRDVDEVLGNELKSSVVNTATTIVAPAAGATGIVRITVYYRTAA